MKRKSETLTSGSTFASMLQSSSSLNKSNTNSSSNPNSSNSQFLSTPFISAPLSNFTAEISSFLIAGASAGLQRLAINAPLTPSSPPPPVEFELRLGTALTTTNLTSSTSSKKVNVARRVLSPNEIPPPAATNMRNDASPPLGMFDVSSHPATIFESGVTRTDFTALTHPNSSGTVPPITSDGLNFFGGVVRSFGIRDNKFQQLQGSGNSPNDGSCVYLNDKKEIARYVQCRPKVEEVHFGSSTSR